MEFLGILEKKIEKLVTLVGQLRSERDELRTTNERLKEKIAQLEGSLMQQDTTVQKWDQEKASVEKVVDELIADIDLLMEGRSE